MQNLTLLRRIAWILVIIGGINWGLVGLAGVDLVSMIFGISFLARLVYILVGVSAAFLIYLVVTKKEPF